MGGSAYAEKKPLTKSDIIRELREVNGCIGASPTRATARLDDLIARLREEPIAADGPTDADAGEKGGE